MDVSKVDVKGFRDTMTTKFLYVFFVYRFFLLPMEVLQHLLTLQPISALQARETALRLVGSRGRCGHEVARLRRLAAMVVASFLRL